MSGTFMKKLGPEHDNELSYTWVKQALEGAGAGHNHEAARSD